MSVFRVGQKVVCVEVDRLSPGGMVILEVPDLPVVGRIYTIRAVLLGVVCNTPCVKLGEICDQKIDVLVNGELMRGDVVFEASGFRPVVDRKTDIGAFKAMLTPSKARERA